MDIRLLMVEIKMKYKIGVRRFGLINWIGAWTLYKKEVLRFLVVWIQTIFSPLVSSLLFLLVLSLAIGAERGEVLGVPFITFLAPGLISMQVIQQAFSHSSSSFMIGKIQGNIVDILYAPLSPAEVTLLISLASVTRSVLIAIVSIFI
jgi:ABC-2 type transport system permease protein